MSENLTIQIPEDICNDLKELSKLENVSISELVKESVKKYIMIQRFKRLSKKITPFAESQGLLTDEDIFMALS